MWWQVSARSPCRRTRSAGTLQAMPTRYPVALLAYARPDTLACTLEPLREAGVPRLYAYVDGVRVLDDAPGHTAVLAQLRAITWADVVLVERPQNLGLHASVRAGLDDFFAREAGGIVLEDDNRLATGAYAWLCEALDRYAEDRTVGAINAWAHPRIVPADVDRPWWSARWSGWGWGGWRRTWALMQEPFDMLLTRLTREGINPTAYGADVLAVAKLGYWDAQLGLALNGARMLTLYPPRSLADHVGIGVGATNQRSAAQWRAVPAAPLAQPWPWPAQVAEHVESRVLWKRASTADTEPERPLSLSLRLRRRAVVAWQRLSRARRTWPEAVALSAALARERSRGAKASTKPGRRPTTLRDFLWDGFLRRHRDACYGRGLEVDGDAALAAVGASQFTTCDSIQRSAVEALPEGGREVCAVASVTYDDATDRAMLAQLLHALRDEGTLLVSFDDVSTVRSPYASPELDRAARWLQATRAGVQSLLRELGIDEEHVTVEPLGGVAPVAAYVLGVPLDIVERRVVDDSPPIRPLSLGVRITKPVGWAPPRERRSV